MKPRSLELIDALRDPNAKRAGSSARAIAEAHGVEIYHLRHLAWALEYCGFAGHTVLEVGGSLPRGLISEFTEVRNWVCLEYIPYYEELNSKLRKEYTTLCEGLDPHGLELCQVISGAIEDLPGCWNGRFDSIFSVACFEHITRLPLGLAAMAKALSPQGKDSDRKPKGSGRLYSGFAPIWSSASGYHMSLGEIPYLDSSIGHEDVFFDYMHLLMSPVELFYHLREGIGEVCASHVVYHIHHSNHINRLYIPDYVLALKSENRFSGEILPYARRQIPDRLKAYILSKQSRAIGLEYDGLIIRAEVSKT